MTLLVSVADTKARLRITHSAEDADLEAMIHGASAAVMNYLGVTEDAFMANDSSSSSEPDSDGPELFVPPEVELATLVLIGILARDRDGVEAKEWEQGYLPRPVTAILYPLRDPALG
jgi:hypothetical protein